jgi:hypothetical protein
MTVTSFNVNPRADRSAVVLDWATRSTGDCKAVVGRLDELYENSPPGNYELYHTHAVGFSGSQHVDPYPPRRCGGTYKVDFFLAFQNPNGSTVATAIRTVPFTWPPCAVP